MALHITLQNWAGLKQNEAQLWTRDFPACMIDIFLMEQAPMLF
jgi:hypothetical protein